MYRPFGHARKGQARENCRSLRGEEITVHRRRPDGTDVVHAPADAGGRAREVGRWDFPSAAR